MTTIEPWLREILRCPACTGVLREGTEGGSDRVVELHCTVCRVAYPVEDGYPVLLVDEARTGE